MTDPVFRSAYDFLAPSPDANYGSVLPFAYNREGSPSWVTEGSNPRFALPEWLRSAAQGVVGLGESTQTGSLTPEALALLTTGSVGTGALFAPRGAMTSGGRSIWDLLKETQPSSSRVMSPEVRSQFRDLYPPDNDNLSRQQWQSILEWANSRRNDPAFSDVVARALYQNEADEQWRRALAKPSEVKGYGGGVPGFSVAPPQQAPPPGPGFRVAKDMVF